MVQLMIYSLLALVFALTTAGIISKVGRELRAGDSQQRASKPQPQVDEERGYHRLENLDFFS